MVATDCSGSIGEYEMDDVQADLVTVSYYMTRVALMELISEDISIIGYTISNLTRDGWDKINQGIRNAMEEIGLGQLPFIGSSETNFAMKQTGLGITVMGLQVERPVYQEFNGYAVIGSPLIGQDVIQKKDEVIELNKVKTLRALRGVGRMIPVGSRGIGWEFKDGFSRKIKACEVDINRSSGPATCIIVNYCLEDESLLKTMFGNKFHRIEV